VGIEKQLDKAVDLARKKPNEALVRVLIEAWRTNRSARLANLVDAATQAVPRRTLFRKSDTARATAWSQAIASGDELDVPRLCDAIEAGPLGERIAALEIAVAALAKFPAHPSFATMVAALLTTTAYPVDAIDYYQEDWNEPDYGQAYFTTPRMEKAFANTLAPWVLANIDERSIGVLQPFSSHANVRNVLSKLRDKKFALSPAEAERCTKLEALLPAPTRSPITRGHVATRASRYLMAQPHARIDTHVTAPDDACFAMPVFRHLRRLDDVSVADLEHLLQFTPPLSGIEEIGLDTEKLVQKKVFATTSGLPSLRVLRIRPGDTSVDSFARVWKSPLARTLREIEIVGDFAELGAWLQALGPTTVERFRLSWGLAIPIELTRTGSEPWHLALLALDWEDTEPLKKGLAMTPKGAIGSVSASADATRSRKKLAPLLKPLPVTWAS
jgi:hypothetical protein